MDIIFETAYDSRAQDVYLVIGIQCESAIWYMMIEL